MISDDKIQQVAISKAQDFRNKRQPFPVELPSGNTVMLKPVSTELVLGYGNIPDYLTVIVEEYFTGKAKEPTKLEDLKKNIDFMNLVCELSFVEPKVSDNPKDDSELSFLDIDERDKFFVVSLMNQPSQVLEKFRKEQESNVDAVSVEQVNEQ